MTVVDLIKAVTDGEVPMRVEAFDGSATGATDSGLTLKLHNERGCATW